MTAQNNLCLQYSLLNKEGLIQVFSRSVTPAEDFWHIFYMSVTPTLWHRLSNPVLKIPRNQFVPQ